MKNIALALSLGLFSFASFAEEPTSVAPAQGEAKKIECDCGKKASCKLCKTKKKKRKCNCSHGEKTEEKA